MLSFESELKYIMGRNLQMIAEEKSKLDEDIQLFADELKRYFSEEEIEEIARETNFVKRQGKIKHVNSFVYAVLWM